MENRLEFIKSIWFMWVALILFAPLGIFLMWKYNERLSENKKIVLSVAFSVLFVFTWIPSCVGINSISNVQRQEQQLEQQANDNKKIAQEVEKKITLIGDPKTVTLEKSQTVKDAKTAYDELTAEQKGMISYNSLKVLIISEDTITTLESKATADKAAADKAAADKAAADKAAADKAAASTAQSSASSSSSSSGQSQSSSETIGTTVYITNTGEKYHSDGCSSLNKSKIAISLADAKAQGYDACSKCHPPQ